MYATKPAQHWLPIISLLFTASLWGIVWYPLRLLESQGLTGLWSSLISYGAAMLAGSWVFFREARVLRENFLQLMLMGVMAGWCNVAFILAVLDGTIVRVLLLFYLSPFWAVCLGWLLLGERLDGKSLLVFLLAVSGAMIMLWDAQVGMPWPREDADWLAVSSGFAFALSNVLVRRLQPVGVWLKSASSWLGVVLVALAWIAGGGAAIPAVAPGIYLLAIVLGLCGFLLMTLTVQYGVSHMPVHRSAVILLFELVVGALSSLLLTDEVVLVREWIGGAMIVTAAWIAARIHAGNAP
ncbi:MAG: DMT family transporter [Gammaproteobacteria bacterium]|jgi:drug/metabolite transporter (DMT)-like permease